jgi:aminodeoxyfutalosine deaminase
MTAPELTDFIQRLPKAELHVHLEGAIAPETVLNLAKRHNMEEWLPSTSVEGLRRWFRFTDFNHFVKI